jgi:hypothetical protein
MGAFAGAAPLASPRPLSLTEISETHGHRQFDGDGSVVHPPLYNRDVVAFLPFQASAGRLAVPL